METIKWIRGNSKFPDRVKVILDMNSAKNSRCYFYNDDKCIFSIIYGVVHCIHADTDLAKAIIENGEELKMNDTIPLYEFKPFDKVLTREDENCVWEADLFDKITFYDGDKFYNTFKGYCRLCIPYEGNEELLGTKLNPK